MHFKYPYLDIFNVCVVFVLAGCGTANKIAPPVSHMAPGFEARLPPTETDLLGHRRLGNAVDVNTCFSGTPTVPSRSIDEFNYESKFDNAAQMTAAFGDLITSRGGLEKSAATRVQFKKVSDFGLSSLFLDPKSACAQADDLRREYQKPAGRFESVITRALRAEELSVSYSDLKNGGVSAQFRFKGVEPTALISSSNSLVESWTGQSLFFAEERQSFIVKLEKKTFTGLPINGSTPGVGSCNFAVIGEQDNAWKGVLNCEGDTGASRQLHAPFNGYDGAQTGAGTSYGVTVSSARPGFYDVTIARWTVRDR